SYVDLVLIMEEMGRVVLPSPFIWTVMVAEAIKRAGSEQQKSTLWPKIATGDLIATIAYLENSASSSADGITMTARRDRSGYSLDGAKLFVNDGHIADCILVAARTGESGSRGITLFALETRRAGIAVARLNTMDQTRKLTEVTFANVKADAGDVLGEPGKG